MEKCLQLTLQILIITSLAIPEILCNDLLWDIDSRFNGNIPVQDPPPETIKNNRVIPVVIPENGSIRLNVTCVREDYDKELNKDPSFKYGGLSLIQEEKIVPQGENFAKWTKTIEITSANAGEKKVSCDYNQNSYDAKIIEAKFYIYASDAGATCNQETCKKTLAFRKGTMEDRPREVIVTEVKRQLTKEYGDAIDESEKHLNIFKVNVDCTEGKCSSAGLSGGIMAAIVIGITATFVVMMGVIFKTRDNIYHIYERVVKR